MKKISKLKMLKIKFSIAIQISNYQIKKLSIEKMKKKKRIRNNKFRFFCIMIANMLIKFDIVRKFDKTTFTCKNFCMLFCNTNFFDFLTFFFELLLYHLFSEILSKILSKIYKIVDNLNVQILNWCLFDQTNLFRINIANSFDLQISFTTKKMISMNLINVLRNFENNYIEHEIIDETIA